jgi:cob(I)alamin adenosyltransferase
LNLTLGHRLASLAVSADEGTELTIGELAEAVGVTVRTIRHYEAVGLLPTAQRSDGGHRRYDEHAVDRMRRILVLRELGFGLEPIRRILSSESRSDLIEAARRQLERTEVEIELARRLRERLRRVLALLGGMDEEPIERLIDEMEVSDMTLKLDRIYTGLGDAGETDLADATRVRKTDAHVEAGGALDELRAQVGAVLAGFDLPDRERSWLKRIENDLMDVGSDLSTPFTEGEDRSRPRLGTEYIDWVEDACDRANTPLDALDSFVAWFDSPLAAQLDVCRAVCRRAERRAVAVADVNPQIIRYLNRLSDLLFILSRRTADGREALWEPGRGAEVAAR